MRKLFTVGPVEVLPDTLKAMDRPMIVHRGKDYQNLQRGIVEKLHKALDTDLQIFLSPASATGFLESCVRCGVHENGRYFQWIFWRSLAADRHFKWKNS